MYLERLNLINFKNVREADLTFSEKINCLIGHNGAGKTNVLDSIYFLSHCKSFYNTLDTQCARHGADFMVIEGHYVMEDGRDERVYCGLQAGKHKKFKRNDKVYKRLSDHIGLLPLVIVSPADQTLINGGSSERRRLVDSIISQRDHEYLHLLIRYNNALQQRNALLKQEGRVQDEVIDVWDYQLSEYGTEIFKRRKTFIDALTPIFQHYYSYLSEDKERVGIGYESTLTEESLADQLKKNRERDLRVGFTTCGTHRDDLNMLIEDYPINQVGSQGQCKTYLLALKLAQFDFLKKETGKTPLLLFDDIFDKLDARRVGRIIELTSSNHFGQIFITDTNREHIDDLIAKMGQENKIFDVEDGEVRELRVENKRLTLHGEQKDSARAQ